MRDCSPVIPKTRQLRWRCRMAFGGVVLAAAALRLPVISQSLWYDEMYTLLNYILQPWERIVAGEYSPNNHIFFTLLAKLATPDTGDLAALQSEIGGITVMIRLVSLLAGIALPVALAWGIRKEQPYQAILLAVIAAVHPWAIGLSGWARGYTLMML